MTKVLLFVFEVSFMTSAVIVTTKYNSSLGSLSMFSAVTSSVESSIPCRREDTEVDGTSISYRGNFISVRDISLKVF